MTQRFFYSVLFFGMSLISVFGQKSGNLEERKTLALLQVELPTTTAKMLSLLPEPGMTVYNTNEGIQGNVSYPAIGKGIYTFDGTGWIANKVREMPAVRPDEMEPYVSNAVILLAEGTFKTPSPKAETGRYFHIRNISVQASVYVSSVIDYGESQPKLIELKPKQGAMMIYSDGTHWYRIN